LTLFLKQLPVGTSLYGTGEVSGQLERTGKRVSQLYEIFSFKEIFLIYMLLSYNFILRFSHGTLMHGVMALELHRYTNHIHGC
jgi:hypothetical protein